MWWAVSQLGFLDSGKNWMHFGSADTNGGHLVVGADSDTGQ